MAESHGASVFIDEAHSMLACGENGRGAAEKFGVEDRITACLRHIFKSVWCAGRISSPARRRRFSYLRFYAHPYVYSCALPPVVIAAILKSAGNRNEPAGVANETLGKRRLLPRATAQHSDIDTGASTTYMMPIVIGDRERMYRLGHELRRRGLVGRAGGLSGCAAKSRFVSARA